MIRILATMMLILINCSIAICQTKAITEFNDTIYVYNDGTWSFELREIQPETINSNFFDLEVVIDTLQQIYSFNESSNKDIKTNINQFNFKYNDKKWSRIPPGSLNDEAEFAFEHKVHDLWCIIITEETEISKINILKIAKATMEENLGTDVTVRKVEMRKVNGHDVLRGVFETDLSGIALIFDTYYYSDVRGTTQITTYTSANLWDKYESEIVDFLNGIVINELEE